MFGTERRAMNRPRLTDQPLAGELIAEAYADWAPQIRNDFVANSHNGHVGTRLLSESRRARVWEIVLAPGERVSAHRHVLDYFWTAGSSGSSLQHTSDGTTRAVSYVAGETRHFTFAAGEFLLHDLVNIGDTVLEFITVEFLDSANGPLPLAPRA